MGYIRHHAILVTGTDPYIQKAHQRATEIFGEPQGPFNLGTTEVSEITPESVNAYRTFMVAPDGSKEWRPHSDQGDEARNVFVQWLRGNGGLTWVEVKYGDEEDHNGIVHASTHDGEEV